MAKDRAKDLRSKNGEIVGTREYFGRINEQFNTKTFVGKYNFDYCNIDFINEKIAFASKKILSDLKNNSKFLSYIDYKKREKLKNFINGIYELSVYGGLKNNDLEQITNLLNLYDSSTRRNSMYSEKDIDKLAKDMYYGVNRTKLHQ